MAASGDKSSKKISSEIRVTVRIKQCRPLRKSVISKVAENSNIFKLNNEIFTFDHVKWGNESQERVYKTAAYSFVQKALQGFSTTILTFGPTGSGKSYTMGSLATTEMNNWQNSGLMQRCLKHIFEESKIQVSASFVEICNEELRDLLNMGATVHRGLAFDPKIEEVKSLQDGLQLLNKALQLRKEHPTSSSSLQYISSSQSHAVLTLRLKIEIGKKLLESKINLVDLAGSRIAAQTGSGSDLLDGRSYFDESLLALSKAIVSTSEKLDPKLFVSTKDSVLTSVLKDLLNIEYQRVSLVACIGSDPASNCKEILRTLRIAMCAKKVEIQRSTRLGPGILTSQHEVATQKLPLDLSPESQKKEIVDKENREPLRRPATEGSLKNCFVVLKKSDVDFYGNKENQKFKENKPLNHNETVIKDETIILTNVEATFSTRTESTLSIGRLQTQNTDHQIFSNTYSSASQYNEYTIRFNDSLSMSSLEDMAVAKPAKPDAIKEEILAGHYHCPFGAPEFPNESIPILRTSTRQAAEETQSILEKSVSQLSICSGEERAFPRLVNSSSDSQLFEAPGESYFSRTNKMKRMNAILTTDFSEPGPSQTDNNHSARKIMKLDEKDPLLMLTRVPRSQLVSEETRLEETQHDEIENRQKELNDKQLVHNNRILKVLNTSTATQLTALPQIGVKRAVTIYQYRLIHGAFKSLKDLKNIPVWSKKICNRFFAVGCYDININPKRTTYFLNSIRHIASTATLL